jgi:hypothetical protein
MTVGQARLSAIKYIEHAVRRCGVSPALLTSEGLLSAKENLGMILSSMVTQGMELWCVEKQAQGAVNGKARYPLDDGTVDVLDVLRRTGSSLAGSIISNVLVYNGDAVSVTSADFVVGNTVTAANIKLQHSDNGSTWISSGSVVGDFAAGDRVILDSSIFASAAYWRVTSTTAHMASGSFLSGATEIPLGVLNRDDYVNLSNKTTPGLPNSCWIDKEVDAANVVVWPVPNDESVQLVFWVHRQISDVTAYPDIIEVPQRWQDAIIFELSTRVFMELPKTQVDPGRYDILKTNAAEYLGKAMRGETDGSPVRIAPRISPYTRG